MGWTVIVKQPSTDQYGREVWNSYGPFGSKASAHLWASKSVAGYTYHLAAHVYVSRP